MVRRHTALHDTRELCGDTVAILFRTLSSFLHYLQASRTEDAAKIGARFDGMPQQNVKVCVHLRMGFRLTLEFSVNSLALSLFQPIISL